MPIDEIINNSKSGIIFAANGPALLVKKTTLLYMFDIIEEGVILGPLP